jgi:hypothetical protein
MTKARRRRQVRVIARRARAAVSRDEHGVMSVVVGGIAGFLMNTDMVKQSDWLQKHWYALPIALLLVGYALAKRKNPHGKTLMALGGYLFINGFSNQPKTEQTPPGKKSQGEAGSPWWDWQAPAGQWVVTPDGQRVLMPAMQWQRYQDAGAPVLPERIGHGAANQVVEDKIVEDIYGR